MRNMALIALIISVISIVSQYHLFFYRKDDLKARMTRCVPFIDTNTSRFEVEIAFINNGNRHGMIPEVVADFPFQSNFPFASDSKPFASNSQPFSAGSSMVLPLNPDGLPQTTVVPPHELVLRKYSFKCPDLKPYNAMSVGISAMDSHGYIHRNSFDPVGVYESANGKIKEPPFHQMLDLYAGTNTELWSRIMHKPQ